MTSWNNIIEKLGSLSGQDLRTKPVGFSSMPTDDSKQQANQLLRQSSAEVGPTPNIKPPKGPSLQDVAIKMPSQKGSLPKLGAQGAIMNSIDEARANDPLVKFMQKQAEKIVVSDHMKNQALQQLKDKINELFAHPQGVRPKFTEKDLKG